MFSFTKSYIAGSRLTNSFLRPINVGSRQKFKNAGVYVVKVHTAVFIAYENSV